MLGMVTKVAKGFVAVIAAAAGALGLVWIGSWLLWLFGAIDDPTLYTGALTTWLLEMDGWKRVIGIVGGSVFGAFFFDGAQVSDIGAISGRGNGQGDQQDTATEL